MSQREKRLVVFLGAGASAFVGIPDSTKLAQIVEQELRDHSNRIQQIRDRIQNFGLTYDIEALLSVLSFWANPRKAIDETGAFFAETTNYSSVNSFRKNSRDINIARSAKETIVRECFVNDRSRIYAIKRQYEKFFKDLHDVLGLRDCDPAGNKPCPPIDVFTTNYDNVVEEYCIANGMICCDGYKEPPGRRRGTCEFDQDEYSNSPTLLRLYKLHGTVTLARLSNGELVNIPLYPGGELRISGKPAFFDLIYPGTFLYATREPQLELLNLLKQNLSSSDWCIIIGYSFRDPNVRQIFIDVLLRRKQTRRRFKVILIDPEADKIIAKHRLGRLGMTDLKKKFEQLNVNNDIGGHFS